MVEIKVGPEGSSESFYMHEGILCFYSDYFKGALKGEFLEARKGVVVLETEEAAVFARFQYWVYGRRFCHISETETKAVSWSEVAKLWVFGDSHNIPLLQNQVIDLMKRKVIDLWENPVHELDYIYQNTIPGAALRKFSIDVIGRTSGLDEVSRQDLDELFDKEALIDLVEVIWKTNKPKWYRGDVDKLDMCQYHVHEEGTKCGAVKKE